MIDKKNVKTKKTQGVFCIYGIKQNVKSIFRSFLRIFRTIFLTFQKYVLYSAHVGVFLFLLYWSIP